MCVKTERRIRRRNQMLIAPPAIEPFLADTTAEIRHASRAHLDTLVIRTERKVHPARAVAVRSIQGERFARISQSPYGQVDTEARFETVLVNMNHVEVVATDADEIPGLSSSKAERLKVRAQPPKSLFDCALLGFLLHKSGDGA